MCLVVKAFARSNFFLKKTMYIHIATDLARKYIGHIINN